MNNEIIKTAQDAKLSLFNHISSRKETNPIIFDFTTTLFDVRSEYPEFSEQIFNEIVQANLKVRPSPPLDPNDSIGKLAYSLSQYPKNFVGSNIGDVFEPLFALYSFFHRLSEAPQDAEAWKVSYSSAYTFNKIIAEERKKLNISMQALEKEHNECYFALTTFLKFSTPQIGLSLDVFKYFHSSETNIPRQPILKESSSEFTNFRRENDVLKFDEIAIAISYFRRFIESSAK